MTDGQVLLLVFFLLYLTDCVFWAPRASVAFKSWGKSRFRLVRPGGLFSNEQSGTVVGFPFPPLGTLFFTQSWPVALSEKGVATYTLDAPNPGGRTLSGLRAIVWEKLEKVGSEGKKVFLNRKRFCVSVTNQMTGQLAYFIDRARAKGGVEREPAIRDAVRASFNWRRVRGRVRQFRIASGFLRFHCNLLFVLLFVALPFVYWKFGASWRLLAVALGVWIIMLSITANYFHLHRRFYPGLAGERWQNFFLLCLVPQHSIRALDELSKGLMAGFHPLAVASVLLEEDQFTSFASKTYRDLVHPLPLEFDEDAEVAPLLAISRDYSETILRPEVERFFEDRGLSLASLLLPPEREDEENRSFCPRCHAQYAMEEGGCGDCAGLALHRMD